VRIRYSFIICGLILVIFIFTNSGFTEEETQVVTGSAEKISLDLRGIDIIELLKVLSLKTGLTIVPQSGVKGRVSLFLNNVRFDDVLDIILITYGLACERHDNIINIMTAEQYYSLYGKRYEEKRKMKSFRLNYAKPVDVFNTLSQLKSDIGKIIVDESSATVILVDIPEKLDLMEGMIKQLDLSPEVEVFGLRNAKAKELETQVSKVLTTGPGEVAIDERTNKMMIMDLPEKMKSIKRLVRAFDEESSQVFIEAEIIELSLSDKFQRGIDWEGIFRGINDLDFKGKFSLGLSGTSNRQEISMGTVERDDYNVILQLLQTYGRTHIISEPRIAAVNNQEAKILVGSREAYITQTLSAGQTTTTTAESIEYVDVGVKLNVTPTISKDGFVTMKIRPEVSSVREYLTTTLGSRIPIVDTSEAETVVKVKDGAMVMIAGLTKKKEFEEKKEMPFLSKVPILGMFFSRQVKGPDTPRHSELIVFITPRIISGDVQMPKEAVESGLVLKKEPKGLKEE
jgi:type II secretory pathway component GspD/PulD (secretin)